MEKVILDVKNLTVKFNLRGKALTPVRNVSLQLYKGETLAVVGESGSGKSVLTKSFVGMLDNNGYIEHGEIVYDGEDLSKYSSEKQWLKIRGKKIAMIFQDPMTALNPLKTIGEQIREILELHRGMDKTESKKEAVKLLEMVGIQNPEIRYKQYQHEFSGGMRQRVVIASAIACQPDILICDEPTTALDVTIQAQILQLIKKVQKQYGMSVIFITHDLGVVANVADRVAVMYAGEIIEYGMVNEIFKTAKHPYTKALLKSLPQLGTKNNDLYAINGTPPNLYKNIRGDAFAYRNENALKIDYMYNPPFFKVSDTHYAKTWLLHEKAQHLNDSENSYKQNIIENNLNPNNSKEKSTKENIENKNNGSNMPNELSHISNINKEVLVSLKNVDIDFKTGKKAFKAVQDVSLDIYKGETLSLVGESGSGKTTIGRAIMKIVPVSNGEIRFKDKVISKKLKHSDIMRFRQSVQMIFQDPMACLNERAKVDYIVSEGIYNYKLYDNERDRLNKVSEAMLNVGLPSEFSSRFPHEFSGGQRQRIGIARALIMNPEFVIADEPISALDVSIRAQIINLLNKLKRENELTYLFIAHDLSVVRFISDRIAVIYKGHIVEMAESEELFNNPLHPYTKALLSAIPIPDPELEKNKKLVVYDPSIHNYESDKPFWAKIYENHYVYANTAELEEYKMKLAVNE